MPVAFRLSQLATIIAAPSRAARPTVRGGAVVASSATAAQATRRLQYWFLRRSLLVVPQRHPVLRRAQSEYAATTKSASPEASLSGRD